MGQAPPDLSAIVWAYWIPALGAVLGTACSVVALRESASGPENASPTLKCCGFYAYSQMAKYIPGASGTTSPARRLQGSQHERRSDFPIAVGRIAQLLFGRWPSAFPPVDYASPKWIFHPPEYYAGGRRRAVFAMLIALLPGCCVCAPAPGRSRRHCGDDWRLVLIGLGFTGSCARRDTMPFRCITRWGLQFAWVVALFFAFMAPAVLACARAPRLFHGSPHDGEQGARRLGDQPLIWTLARPFFGSALVLGIRRNPMEKERGWMLNRPSNAIGRARRWR